MPPPNNKDRKSLAELQAIERARPPVPQITVVTGLPGSGKTTLAATLFDEAVTSRLALDGKALATAPEITLKGAIWIEADKQGLVSLTTKKIRPEFVLSIETLFRENGGNLHGALRDLFAYVGEAKEAGATGLVMDTVTSYGGQWLVPQFVDGNDNGFAGWQSVANYHSKLLGLGSDLGLRQVWLAQPVENKLEVAADDKKATDLDKAKALAKGVGGGRNYVVPAISGQAFRPVLNAQCSMSSWLRASNLGGKKVRELLPFGGDGSQGKTRYEGILGTKEPADLGAIDRKIMAAQGGKA